MTRKSLFGDIPAKECSHILTNARIEIKKDFQLILAPVPAVTVSAEPVKKKYTGTDKEDGVIVHKGKRVMKKLVHPYKLNKHTVENRRATDDPFGSPVLERHGKFFVVRDDLLYGGTKCRMLYDLLAEHDNDVWAYASPAQGYAQIAIAICCAMVRKKAVIYVAKSETLHPLTKMAFDFGAEIRMVPMGFLSNVTAKTKRYVQQHDNARLVPFGGDSQLAINALAQSAAGLEFVPKHVWSICSTGTLSRGLQRAWPKAQHNGVMVGHIPSAVQRGNCNVYIAPEQYTQKAKVIPPFPSAYNYDAKVWRFLQEFGKKDSLFWNVGA